MAIQPFDKSPESELEDETEAKAVASASQYRPILNKLLSSLRSWLTEYAEPLKLWLAFRIVLFILPFFATLLFPFQNRELIPPEALTPSLWADRLLRSWARWDGGWYIDLANFGYAAPDRQEIGYIVFFPLYSHLVRAVAFLFTFGKFSYTALNIAGIIVSSLATLACFVGLFKLARLDYDDETSRYAVIYMAAFPMAFFMLAVYTEALFMALAVWAFWAGRQQRWWLAGLLTGLAILTKNQGLILVGALGLEYLHQIGFNPLKINRRILAFGLPILAFGGWLLINVQTCGDAFCYLRVQSHFNHFPTNPLDTFRLATEKFFLLQPDTSTFLTRDYEPRSIHYDYLFLWAFIGLTLFGIFAVWKQRLRLSYLVFLALCVVQPMNYPAKDDWLASMPRYLMIAFPAYFLLALLGRRSKVFHYSYLGLSLPLLGLFLTRFALNYWVA